MPGNAGDVIDEEKGARVGVDVRALAMASPLYRRDLLPAYLLWRD